MDLMALLSKSAQRIEVLRNLALDIDPGIYKSGLVRASIKGSPLPELLALEKRLLLLIMILLDECEAGALVDSDDLSRSFSFYDWGQDETKQ
ncbi:hypothetical protein QIL46_gp2 [ssRNA phage Esthiorhiza.2_38]|uniref:Uncharacterized protein n=2 Tax=Fiersviridae TaxID=2842319 RepID=A0A8S5KYK3_9VIRU|nr:hypothetical protein QIL46_gp2 [ssRNA phage Esthiorhiza.2_38]QDH87733.1 MAG: hypothetical protein H2RhizoLitter49740_000002 [Leviviridae sp.]DAD50392.1 TPA_asm: hypothetical protein [ssRNA phage Esthiorhiza.2_38]